MRELLPHLGEEGLQPLLRVRLNHFSIFRGDGIRHDVAVPDKAVVVAQNRECGDCTNQVVELARLPEHLKTALLVPMEANDAKEFAERRRDHGD